MTISRRSLVLMVLIALLGVTFAVVELPSLGPIPGSTLNSTQSLDIR